MDDYTVRGSNPSRGPLPTNHAESTGETNTPDVSHEKPHQDTKTESTSTKSEVKSQHGAQMRTERNASGNFKQNELNQKLAAGKAQAKEFPADASKKELDKIHVTRQKGLDDEVITQYPNGVKLKKSNTYTTYSKDIQQASTNSIKLQKAGNDVAIEVEGPPGGKVTANKAGGATISDAKGKVVATVDKDGTLHAHSKEGNYTQSPDGKIKFEQKYKGDLESLRKKGPIDPSKYEDYGITTDGKTIRLPNGVEITPPQPEVIGNQTIPNTRKDPFQGSIRIPKELGQITEYQKGSARSNEIRSARGEVDVTGSNDYAIVRTERGDFIVVQPGPKISYEPH